MVADGRMMRNKHKLQMWKSRQTRIPDAFKDDPQRRHRQYAEALSAPTTLYTEFYIDDSTAKYCELVRAGVRREGRNRWSSGFHLAGYRWANYL